MPGAQNWGCSLIFVTGASKGLGAVICQEFSKRVMPGSIIVGLARTELGLHQTKMEILKQTPSIEIITSVTDLVSISEVEIESLFNDIKSYNKHFDSAILVHNAGTLGQLKYLRDINETQSVNEFYMTNICSVIPLNTTFLRFVRTNSPKAKIHVINISSLAAVKSFKTWGLYCSAKAARDMLFKVLALEEPEIDVLNYAPGPLDNDMQALVRNSDSDLEMQQIFINMKNEGKLVAMETSVAKLLKVLEEGKYSSGDHVDFYDD